MRVERERMYARWNVMTPLSMRNGFHGALDQLAQLDKSDLDQALRRIVTIDADVLRVDRVSYWELTADRSAIHCRMLYQRGKETFSEGTELRAADYPMYFSAMLNDRLIVAHDAWTDPRTKEFVDTYFRQHDIRSMLDVPVWRRGKLAGVVCHEHVGTARMWKPEEQDFALGIGNMTSHALEAFGRRRAEEGYALLARATNDVVWDWDVTNDVIDWNDALFSVFRYRPSEVRSSVEWWAERLHPDDRQRVKQALEDAVGSGVTTWSDQYRWMRGDGTVATVIDRGYIVRNERGTPLRMVGSMLDITERVEMEARIRLSDRMASVGTLAAGVAHEICNPLTYVSANLTCALDALRTADLDREQMRELLAEAQEGAERIRRIVRDLKAFSHPREDETEDLDLATVVDSSINMAWNEIRHRAQLVKDYGQAPRVRMNRARLGQVVLNLLVNAAHAIAEGNVDRNRIEIRLGTSPDGDAMIEIRDTGAGIPADVVGRVFEPFFTTKPVGVGTGLGLAICHSIVTAAGGRIALASPASGGCIVRITLPAALVVTPAPPVAVVEPPRRRILLIDDEAPIRRAVAHLLEQQHDIVVADGGEAALQQIRGGETFDAILCDLMMPLMTGMDLFDRLRDEAPALAKRTIFMTGGAFSQRSSQFLATCGRPHIEKPFDRITLARALSALDAERVS
jgi:PAS domain S-box-containing protein